MKTIYKIIIACVITAFVTAFATAYFYPDIIAIFDDTEVACKDNASPDINGCCPGEEFKDMGDQGFNCCPLDGGDCFPPIVK